VQTFAGVPLHLNLNLLAHALEDRPPAAVALVGSEDYDTRRPGVGVIQVQPFVELRGTTRVELPIGSNLKNFLDYPPIGGAASGRPAASQPADRLPQDCAHAVVRGMPCGDGGHGQQDRGRPRSVVKVGWRAQRGLSRAIAQSDSDGGHAALEVPLSYRPAARLTSSP